MLLGFVLGWIFGSFSMYSYLVLTAKEPPYPECMDCHEETCEGCTVPSTHQQQDHRLAA